MFIPKPVNLSTWPGVELSAVMFVCLMESFCFRRLVWVVEINFVVSNNVLESNPLSLFEHHKRPNVLVLSICHTLLKCCGPKKP